MKKNACLVVIGSGPLGMISSLILKEHFDKVIVLERQSKEKFLKKHGYTYPIVFSPGAIKILEKVGAWKPIISERSEYNGVLIHTKIMGKEFKIKIATEGLYAYWRHHIIEKLYERTLQEKIQIYFNANVEYIDFQDNICKESKMGSIPFNLLLGADGNYSLTRNLMSKAHPKFMEKEFRLRLLNKWHAYRLPSKGTLRKNFWGDGRFVGSYIYNELDKSTKCNFIVTTMRQPNEEISIVIRHGLNVDERRLKEVNERFLRQHVDSIKEFKGGWDAGCSGKYEHVQTPTFYLNSVLLVGDAAHGFVSYADLLSLGIISIGSFYEIFNKSSSIKEALRNYDETLGKSIRYYSSFALRRSTENITGEFLKFEIARKLWIVGRHPMMYNVFEDDFEIQKYMRKYKRDLFRVRLFFYSIPIILLLLVAIFFLVQK